MTAGFRALCAELVRAWDVTSDFDYNDFGNSVKSIVNRARAALADEPAVPEGREPAAVTKQPSDAEQVLRLAAIIREVDGNHSKGAAALAESIFNHPDFRAALADQQQKSPTKHELFKLLLQSGGATQCVSIEWIEPFANAVLARWGRQPAPPTDGEVAELVTALRADAECVAAEQPDLMQLTDKQLTRAAELLQRQAPQPPADGEAVEVVEWLHTVVAAYKSCRNTDHIWSLSGNGVNARLTVTLLTRAAELLQRQALVPVSVSDALIKAECALSDIAEGEPMTDEGDPLQWAERRCADTLAIIRPTMRQRKIRTSEWPPLPLPEVGA